ncbi:SAM-dependent methyltransferase [Bacillus badius]|uniref:N-6 DNA methylase n=1 Tax=Bacillus badius TaxID=1455 RepID=UPI001CBE531D|nr:N-6 DNA methylase [Bacillus badius]UAT31456.1 SAM-dependent methyltransferase [Bacillus badius]
MLSERMVHSQIEDNIVQYLYGIGCTVVRSDVDVNMRNRRGRADLVGFIIDESGKSVPKVVVEVKTAPDPNSQQQLYEYAKALDCPYALLVINKDKYWFDGQTLLPILESPKFESKYPYIEDAAEIKNQLSRSLWKLLDGSGRLISLPKGIAFLASGLLIRAYLGQSDERDIAEWLKIETEEQYRNLLDQASSYFKLEESLLIEEIPISIGEWITLLTEIPPFHKSLGEAALLLIHDVLAKEGRNGEYVSSQHIRSAFKEIIAGLNVIGERAIDLAAGYSSVSFDIYANDLLDVKSFRGYEVVSEVCGIAQVISIVSGFTHLKYVCADSLLLQGDEHNDKYSLVVVDPPLGVKARNNVEYDKFELTSRSRNARTSDLMIEQALNLAEPGGYIVTLVPEGTLFSSGPSSFIRDLVKERAIIEGIISLPSHTMKPFAGVKVSILVLHKKKEVTETAKELFLGNPKSVDDISNVIKEFHNWRRKKGEEV